MIIARNTPLVRRRTNDRRGDGWEIFLIVGDSFDEKTPFRAMLQEITENLSISGGCTLRLPPYEEFEDFIEGEIVWDADVVSVYYEWALGILELSSLERSVLDRLLERISNIIEVSE